MTASLKERRADQVAARALDLARDRQVSRESAAEHLRWFARDDCDVLSAARTVVRKLDPPSIDAAVARRLLTTALDHTRRARSSTSQRRLVPDAARRAEA